MKSQSAGSVGSTLRKCLGVCEAEVPWMPRPRPGDADELLLFCSMNVQGQYEPVDATGFININSLR